MAASASSHSSEASDEDEPHDAGCGGGGLESLSPEALAALGLASGVAVGAAPGPIEAEFEKVSCLGEGAFGAVWLVKSKSRGSHAALKELPRARVTTEAEVRRVWEERAALYAVTDARSTSSTAAVSPALVGAIASFTTALTVCLVMDLVEGAPLHQHVRHLGSLPEETARWYTAEVAGALDWLHTAGWLYRDLKLSNVMVSALDGRIRLVDFGFAKRAERATSVVGTLFTMAPEVIRCAPGLASDGGGASDGDYGCAADWWSLGVLLFEMLTGQPPFGFQDDVHLEGRQVLEKQDRMAAEGLTWPGDAAHGASLAARAATSDLLQVDSSRRLGAQLREHAFFATLDWGALMAPAARGPPFEASLGLTIEQASRSPQRPRRGQRVMGPFEKDPDPFQDF